MSDSKKIVVTGGRGLVGGYLLEASSNHEVISIVRPSSVSNDFEVGIDLENPWSWSEVGLPDKCDAVIHLAQSNSYRNLPDESNQLFQGNVVSLANLLEYAKAAGAKSFVYASTGSVYQPTDETITEDSSLVSVADKGNLYAWSKLSGEALVNSYADCFSTSILRYFFVYGKGGNRQMLLPRIAQQVVDGKTITVQGEGGVVLCPTFAKDAAELCLAALELEGANVINAAGPESISLRKIAELVGEASGTEANFETSEGSAAVFKVNVSRMRECLGRDPVRFEEAVSSLL